MTARSEFHQGRLGATATKLPRSDLVLDFKKFFRGFAGLVFPRAYPRARLATSTVVTDCMTARSEFHQGRLGATATKLARSERL